MESHPWPDIDAARGFVKDEHFRLGAQPFGQDDLLLRSAGKELGHSRHIRRGHGQLPGHMFSDVPFPGEIQDPRREKFPERSLDDVVLQGKDHAQPVFLPVFREETPSPAGCTGWGGMMILFP